MRAAARPARRLPGLRFAGDLPIRDLAGKWGFDADAVHRAYARAREEFKKCLRQVVAAHCVRTAADLDAEGRRIFDMPG